VAALFIGPQMAMVALFYLWPMVYAIYMSLTDWSGLTAPQFLGLENYAKLFTSKTALREMGNTFTYMLGAVPITLLLSLLLASALNRRIPCRGFFRVAYFLPAVTMPVAVAMVWRWLLNSKYGIVNNALRALGLPAPGWLVDPNVIMTTLVLVTVWMRVGYNMIILLAGLQGIGRQYYEAAEVEGAGRFAIFFRVTLPLLSPVLFFLLTMMVMDALKAFDIIFVFSGVSSKLAGGPLLDATRTMVFGIYQNGFSFMRMGYASAQATVLFLIILAMTALQFYLQKKWVHYE
jgi:multiple sugar transport system permease protein